ncbi:unnamed protein product [Cercospora beticola]|nr:unnamed protein product [Cercospora beticola]
MTTTHQHTRALLCRIIALSNKYPERACGATYQYAPLFQSYTGREQWRSVRGSTALCILPYNTT